MATVRDIFTDSLTELGVLAAGETMQTIDADAALGALNRLVDQWASERLYIYSVTRTTWTMVSGTQNYTVGTGGTVNIARPSYVERVNFQDTNADPDLEYPLYSYSDADWQRVRIKAQTATLPTGYYYNPTHPLGTLSFWPIPSSTTLQGVIYAPTAITEFATLDTAIALPPGYRRALVKNVALELAPSYAREPQPLLVQQASDSKAIVKRTNFRPAELSSEPAALGQARRPYGYSIRTD